MGTTVFETGTWTGFAAASLFFSAKPAAQRRKRLDLAKYRP
jgi:hypothetical protein